MKKGNIDWLISLNHSMLCLIAGDSMIKYEKLPTNTHIWKQHFMKDEFGK